MKTTPRDSLRARAWRLAGAAACAGFVLSAAQPVLAECLQADAYYADRDRNAVIAFDQGFEATPGVTNSFTMLIGDAALEGVSMWSAGVERPQAVLLHDCPEGAATPEELDACTLWQGIVYSVSEEGEIGFLPDALDIAADRLLFPGLPWQLSYSGAFERGELSELPFEVFELTGCAG
jgi:hypothetical protein